MYTHAVDVHCRPVRTGRLWILLWLMWVTPSLVWADVVKPALVEISVKTDGTYHIEVRASIEALLTGINARYRNTQEAPNAAAYDELRAQQLLSWQWEREERLQTLFMTILPLAGKTQFQEV